MKTGTRNSFFIYAAIISALTAYFSIHYDSLYVEMHDNLDQHFAWYKILSDNNAWFSGNGEKLPHMGGISRGILVPETQLVNLIFMAFEPLLAHILLIITKFTIAYFSFIKLSEYILYELNNKDIPKFYSYILAVSFALLPGNENLYIAQASIPLILYFYLKFINERSFLTLAFIFAYPVLSELTRFGMFILAYMGVHFLYLFFARNERYKYSLLSILFLSLGYLIVEYRLILSVVLSNEETIRSSMVLISNGDFFKTLAQSLVKGQYHFSSITYIIIPLSIYLYYHARHAIIDPRKIPKPLYVLPSLILFNSIVYSIYVTSDIKIYFWDFLPPLHGWNFSRFIWFNHFFWHLLILGLLAFTYKRFKNYIAITFLGLQIIFTLIYPSYGNDFYRTLKCNYFSDCSNHFSFSEYYSADLFDEVKESIGYEADEKVIAFGMHPSVLAYNGFFTMDGYHNAYYMEYKNKFRTLIEPGLEKSERYKNYFDNWGGRAYIFSEEASYNPSRDINEDTVILPINYKIAREMNIKYVISNNKISLNDDISLLNSFSDVESPYKVRVYEINY